MRFLFLGVLTAAMISIAPTLSWAPEPGMGRGNDHNSNAGGSNSGPGHEGSSNRSNTHQRAASGHFTNHPGDRDSDQWARWQRLDAMGRGSGRISNPSSVSNPSAIGRGSGGN